MTEIDKEEKQALFTFAIQNSICSAAPHFQQPSSCSTEAYSRPLEWGNISTGLDMFTQFRTDVLLQVWPTEIKVS